MIPMPSASRPSISRPSVSRASSKETRAMAEMEPVLERGREALKAYIRALPPRSQPMGGDRSVEKSMAIVTYEDFVANPALCLRYVVQNKASTHILCEDGHLCALFAKHTSTF